MLITIPTRSEREMYDSCAPDYLDGEDEPEMTEEEQERRTAHRTKLLGCFRR